MSVVMHQRRQQVTRLTETVAALGSLSLDNAALAENIAQDAAVGIVQGYRNGSTLTLLDNAGGRFQLVGDSVQAGPTATDFEAGASHSITLRETNAEYPNSPRDTDIAISVANVFEQPNLGDLTLSTNSTPAGDDVTITISGATSGSTITGSVPAGLTLNSGARTITGTPSEIAGGTIILTETLADSANSPKDNILTLNVTAQPSLSALSLAASSIAENTAQDSVISGIVGQTEGSSLSLTDDSGGRFALSGTNLVAGATGTDYEAAPSHNITIREILANSPNSPRDTVLTVTVTNIAEAATLGDLALSITELTEDAAINGTITGATAGSTISATGLPTGLTINGPARTFAWDGTGDVGTENFSLTQTLADSPNSPKDNVLSVTISEAQSFKMITAILLGQSNMEGQALREAQDVDVANVEQFVSYSTSPNYRTLQSDITPLLHPDGFGGQDRVGPGEYIARELLDQGKADKIILVPCAVGASALVGGTWESDATPGSGGGRFEFAVEQANLAIAAAKAKYPGHAHEVQFYFGQGEQDASNTAAQAAYKSALALLIARMRARITDAASAPFVIQSMPNSKWQEGEAGYNADYVPINRAHVEISTEETGVYYARGPDNPNSDQLHYGPSATVALLGRGNVTTLYDSIAPTVTTATPVDAIENTQLEIALTGSDVYQTFRIVPGLQSAEFALTDLYHDPRLTWTGDGTGPAEGDYAVNVAATDGRGNEGAATAITVSVAAAVNAPAAQGNLRLWLQADDNATMKQDVAGSIAVTGAGDRIGQWNDKSANDFDLLASATDHTRPTLVDIDGYPFVQADGTNDYLFRAADIGIYANGGTFFAIVKAAPANDRRLMAMGSSNSNTPFYSPLQSQFNDGGNLGVYLRDDAGVNDSGLVTANLGPGFDDTINVICMVDDTANFTAYIDGVQVAQRAYTRSGVPTLNRFALFALLRSSPVSYFAGNLNAALAYDRPLSLAERQQTTTYLGGLVGKTL